MQAQKLLKRVEERDLYSCTANIRVPEITVESGMDCPKCKRVCLDQEIRLNLEIIKKLSKRNEKERFLKDVWKKFREENQTESEPELELSDELWLEVRITTIILATNL